MAEAWELRNAARSARADGSSAASRWSDVFDDLRASGEPFDSSSEFAKFVFGELDNMNARLLDLEEEVRIDSAPDSWSGD